VHQSFYWGLFILYAVYTQALMLIICSVSAAIKKQL
jgi:hypothetical protein